MADPEIQTNRAPLAAHPRPADFAERGTHLDALGTQYAVSRRPWVPVTFVIGEVGPTPI